MRYGLDIVKELCFKEPGTEEEGYIVQAVHKNEKLIDNMTSYFINDRSLEEALERKELTEKIINKNAKVKIIKVTFEVIE
jgi:hypothetical protein